MSLSLEAFLLKLSHYNHYLEQIAARLSRELRTPVAVVRSPLHNLRATQVSTQGKIYVALADEDVQRLSALVSCMSEATRLESMLADSEQAPCDTARLAAGCVEGYRLA